MEILYLLERLQGQAARAGGAVHVLNGNHEFMNIAGDLRYNTQQGTTDFLRWRTVQSLGDNMKARHCLDPFCDLLNIVPVHLHGCDVREFQMVQSLGNNMKARHWIGAGSNFNPAPFTSTLCHLMAAEHDHTCSALISLCRATVRGRLKCDEHHHVSHAGSMHHYARDIRNQCM